MTGLAAELMQSLAAIVYICRKIYFKFPEARRFAVLIHYLAHEQQFGIGIVIKSPEFGRSLKTRQRRRGLFFAQRVGDIPEKPQMPGFGQKIVVFMSRGAVYLTDELQIVAFAVLRPVKILRQIGSAEELAPAFFAFAFIIDKVHGISRRSDLHIAVPPDVWNHFITAA